MALENLTPEVREEEILNGLDIDPVTRLEYFLKKAANEVPKTGEVDAGKTLEVDGSGKYKLVEPLLERGTGDYSIRNRQLSSQTLASGEGSISLGNRSVASGIGALAVGSKSVASGNFSFAGGGNLSDALPEASGSQSFAFGAAAKALAICAIALGQRSNANAPISAAIGNRVTSNGRACLVIGQSNIVDESEEDTTHGTGARKYLFIIGNGTSDGNVLSNALAVDWAGNLDVSGNLVLGKGTADEVTLTPGNLKALLNLLTAQPN